MNPMTLMLLLGGMGALSGFGTSMMEKKPQAPEKLKLLGYPNHWGPVKLGSTPPDNRAAAGLGNAVTGGIGGMMAGKMLAPDLLGNVAPMVGGMSTPDASGSMTGADFGFKKQPSFLDYFRYQ